MLMEFVDALKMIWQGVSDGNKLMDAKDMQNMFDFADRIVEHSNRRDDGFYNVCGIAEHRNGIGEVDGVLIVGFGEDFVLKLSSEPERPWNENNFDIMSIRQAQLVAINLPFIRQLMKDRCIPISAGEYWVSDHYSDNGELAYTVTFDTVTNSVKVGLRDKERFSFPCIRVINNRWNRKG